MWAFDARTPPASESGRVYESVGERCGACVVNGGDEDMCVSQMESAEHQRLTGRPCGYVELDPRNMEASDVIGWLVHEDKRPLAAEYVRALLAGRPAEERARLLSRVGRALSSAEIMRRIHPEAFRESEE